jgi:serine protease Do
MKISMLKPILFFLAVFVIVSLACGSTPEPTQETEEIVDTAETPEVVVSSGAATTLEDVQGAVVQIEAQGTFVDPEIGQYVGAGRGTGFIIDPSGLAVTNNHVVTGAALLKVWIGGDTSKTYNAKVLGVSECSDLALIDIEGEGFPYLEWYQQPVKVGLDVYSVGFPLGEPEYTLTKGIISKESAAGDTDWASISSVIMHDATINPGNSGGPLVTSDGKVVAVNYRSRPDQDQYFAIGREIAGPIIETLKTGEDVDSIGVNGVAVRSEDGSISGIWVSSVKAGSASDQAGIKGGDILLQLQGFPLAQDGTLAEYCNIIRTHNPGDTIGIEVLRFATSEILEGQLNGNPLTQANYFGDGDRSDEPSDGNSDPAGDEGTSDYVAFTDFNNALYIEVPNWYTEYDDTIWEAQWGDLEFKAASLVIAPDLDSYYGSYDAPGVHLAASKDWGNIGGYLQLLDAVRSTWYQENCTFDERIDYDDSVFEGALEFWRCTPGAESVIVAVRPISDPLAYLVLLQVQTVGTYDPEYLDLQRMLDTFDVSEYYLP